ALDELLLRGAEDLVQTEEPAAARRADSGARRRAAPSAAERRRAILLLLRTWRDLARDLAVAARGGTGQLTHIELLEEISAAVGRVDPAAVTSFLERLDAFAAAIEEYANPELALDVLLLAWPRGRQAA
nr:hypothetical protein [Chloroflexota bacterium]